MLGFIVNFGSSSIKARLIDTDTKKDLFEAKAEHLKTESATITTNADFFSQTLNNCKNMSNEEILRYIVKNIFERGIISNLNEISFVGHRIVHGGTYFSDPAFITEDVIKKIESCNDLAPLHNPEGVDGIKCCRKLLSNIPHIAVFDTAFHQTVPKRNYTYPIPTELTNDGIRKYGFHGTSYSYLTRVLSEKVGRQNICAIMAHIGQGTSICAVQHGVSVYTSMEFSPLSGCMMGTRSGSVDPALIPYLEKTHGLTVKDTLEILNKQSGLFAIAGTSNMLEILAGAENGNFSCSFALDLFCQSIAENIAKGIIALGKRPKQIVFTGGIGENSELVRNKILELLKPFIGEFDFHSSPKYGVSVKGLLNNLKVEQKPDVFVIKTNEELEIALEASELLS